MRRGWNRKDSLMVSTNINTRERRRGRRCKNNRERCIYEHEDQVCHDRERGYEQRKHNQRLSVEWRRGVGQGITS
jgi:hypothetical protein